MSTILTEADLQTRIALLWTEVEVRGTLTAAKAKLTAANNLCAAARQTASPAERSVLQSGAAQFVISAQKDLDIPTN